MAGRPFSHRKTEEENGSPGEPPARWPKQCHTTTKPQVGEGVLKCLRVGSPPPHPRGLPDYGQKIVPNWGFSALCSLGTRVPMLSAQALLVMSTPPWASDVGVLECLPR